MRTPAIKQHTHTEFWVNCSGHQLVPPFWPLTSGINTGYSLYWRPFCVNPSSPAVWNTQSEQPVWHHVSQVALFWTSESISTKSLSWDWLISCPLSAPYTPSAGEKHPSSFSRLCMMGQPGSGYKILMSPEKKIFLSCHAEQNGSLLAGHCKVAACFRCQITDHGATADEALASLYTRPTYNVMPHQGAQHYRPMPRLAQKRGISACGQNLICAIITMYRAKR